jgi:hypothetical protein
VSFLPQVRQASDFGVIFDRNETTFSDHAGASGTRSRSARCDLVAAARDGAKRSKDIGERFTAQRDTSASTDGALPLSNKITFAQDAMLDGQSYFEWDRNLPQFLW